MSKVPVDRATPQIQEPMSTPEEMVDAGNDSNTKITASATPPNAPDVVTTVKAWAAANAALDANNKAKTAARETLATAETNEPALVRRWTVRRNAVLTAIEAYG